VVVQHPFTLSGIIIPLQKRKRSEYEVRTLAVSRRRHIDRPVTSHESKNKLKTPREEGEVLSNTKQSGVEWKANLQTNQAGGTPDGIVLCASFTSV